MSIAATVPHLSYCWALVRLGRRPWIFGWQFLIYGFQFQVCFSDTVSHSSSYWVWSLGFLLRPLTLTRDSTAEFGVNSRPYQCEPTHSGHVVQNLLSGHTDTNTHPTDCSIVYTGPIKWSVMNISHFSTKFCDFTRFDTSVCSVPILGRPNMHAIVAVQLNDTECLACNRTVVRTQYSLPLSSARSWVNVCSISSLECSQICDMSLLFKSYLNNVVYQRHFEEPVELNIDIFNDTLQQQSE